MASPLPDAVGLAALIRAGELTAREAVEAAITRIEDRNPELNAVVHTRFEEALDEVDRSLPDGPLRGVPILVKDLGTDVAGLPSTSGSRLFADYRPAGDSELVARYRRAGLVVLGTTNTPELGKNVSTEPALFGPTRNPWRTTHSTGGSSGGSAAAVAAGLVPVAHGSDGGGSIRIPAAMCGLFGLKPSRGLVPNAPYPSGLASPLSVHHALTRSVRDSAALLDAVAGARPGSPYAAPTADRPYAAEVGAPTGRLRIAWTTTAADGTAADPDCAAAVEQFAKLCEALGHQVVQDAPRYDGAAAAAASGAIMAGALAATVDRRLRQLGRDLREDDLEPFTRSILEHGRAMSAAAFAQALETAETTGWRIGDFFADHDLLLTPTTPATAPPLGLLDTSRPETVYTRAGGYAAFTSVCNLTGQPAMSVPAGPDSTGLPVGVQFVAALGGEPLLLRLAGQLEQAAPWEDRRP